MHVLSILPQLLSYRELGVALVRIAAAVTLLVLAYYHGAKSSTLAAIRFPIVGGGSWIAWVTALIEAIVGALLLVGLYTQGAAILGALIAIKYLLWHRRYPKFFPIERSTSTLLLVICLALIVMGAGSFAFDLPL